MKSSTTSASLSLRTDELCCIINAFAHTVLPEVWSILAIIFISSSLAKWWFATLTIKQVVCRNVSRKETLIQFWCRYCLKLFNLYKEDFEILLILEIKYDQNAAYIGNTLKDSEIRRNKNKYNNQSNIWVTSLIMIFGEVDKDFRGGALDGFYTYLKYLVKIEEWDYNGLWE